MSRLENLEILEDGKNNWKEKKEDNLLINESYKRLAQKYNIKKFYNISYYMLYCASYLEFKLFEDESKKLHLANFCRCRLCPMCNWRRSKKIFGQVSKVVDEIDRLKKYDYIFLTLTIKNCIPEELENNINLISKSFMRMFTDSKKIKNICKGYFRAIEVTYNKKENTYHPHIHCIVVVEKYYFNWRNENYIKTEEWSELWGKYLKIDYLPVVYVSKVTSKKYKNSAVAEISKYTVKSKDIIINNRHGKVNEDLTDKNVLVLHNALKNKRLITFGGIMKELHKKLNLEDLNKDDVDLLNTDVEDNDNLLNYIILKYKWCVGIANYKLIDSIKK